MAHLLAPQPPNRQLPVFFNGGGVVGAPPAQNKREDVLLVQFALLLVIGNSPGQEIDLDLLAAAKALRPTGNADPATITAIRAFQVPRQRQSPNVVVDGRVSPARCAYFPGNGAGWTIALLNRPVQRRFDSIWPRIDKIPGCPFELQQMVSRTVAGTS